MTAQRSTATGPRWWRLVITRLAGAVDGEAGMSTVEYTEMVPHPSETPDRWPQEDQPWLRIVSSWRKVANTVVKQREVADAGFVGAGKCDHFASGAKAAVAP
jgi:hypothetical protein